MRLYFLCGLFAVHMISYWATALLSVFLWPRDIPSKCVRVVLRNQLGYTAWPALFVSGVPALVSCLLTGVTEVGVPGSGVGHWRKSGDHHQRSGDGGDGLLHDDSLLTRVVVL